MITIAWPAPAKLNLFLYITGRRADGYHNLQTLFQFLNYSDTLYIKVNRSGNITLNKKINGINYKNNLIVRAAKLLMQQALINNNIDKTLGAEIYVKKRIPISSGLGGGSSNAATVLIALNYLWNINFSFKTLKKIGLMIGSDVPIFIHGHSAFAEGIGEKFYSVHPDEKWYLVIYPKIKISTALMFHALKLNCNQNRSYSDIMLSPFSNDFEPIVRKRFFQIEKLILWLLQYAPSRLTGTGSCVFSEFKTKNEAYEIFSKIPKYFQGFVAKGINISPLHYLLNIIK